MGLAQHVIQRSNKRQLCFDSNGDFAVYAKWLKEYAEKFDVAVHAWVFMSNHVHLLLTPSCCQCMSLLIQVGGVARSILIAGILEQALGWSDGEFGT